MKLSATKIKLHNEAIALVESDKKLTHEECMFILENFQESANHLNSVAGAFFTPVELAMDFAYEIPKEAKIVDLCAGIGALAYFAYHFNNAKEITCVELNPDYIKIGKRILPEATWVQADALEFTSESIFDVAISNPPFGNIKTSSSQKKKYRGGKFEYKLIEQASHIAKHGIFIIPQASTGFQYSGCQSYTEIANLHLQHFSNDTGIDLDCGSLDTSIYLNDWKGVKPVCEVVTCTFKNAVSQNSFALIG